MGSFLLSRLSWPKDDRLCQLFEVLRGSLQWYNLSREAGCRVYKQMAR